MLAFARGCKRAASMKIMTPTALKLCANRSQMITSDAGSPVPLQQADNGDLKGLSNNREYK